MLYEPLQHFLFYLFISICIIFSTLLCLINKYVKSFFIFQVVTLAVYSYILATIMGSQFIHNESNSDTAPLDMYVPIFSYLQIVFYLGWLKVAESLFNPFGTDDEDFDVNSLVDRNLRVCTV